MNKRLTDLRAKMAQQNLDGLLVTQPQNQFYLSGFTGGDYLDATILISADQAWVSTDSRYFEDGKRRFYEFIRLEAGYYCNKALG